MKTRMMALAAGAALLLAACGDESKPSSSAVAGGDGGGAECPNGKVRFGVEPYEDPAKLTPAYQTLAAALEKKLGCPVELRIVENYSAEVLAMRNDQLELAQFGPLGYVFASEKADAEPLASFGDSEGKLSSYMAGIWVPKDSPIQTVADLRGKALALGEAGSTSGDALPRYAIREAGMKDSDVKLDYTGGHPEALLALTHEKVDAAEINTQQLASAQAAGEFDPSQYRQIWKSEPIPNDPITVNGKLPEAFKAKVKDALTNLDPADVKKVGAFLDVDPPGPMITVDRKTYQPLFDLAHELGLTEKDV